MALRSLRSLRNRHLEVVEARKNGRARGRPRARSFLGPLFPMPATQARLSNADRVRGLKLHP